VKTISEKLYNRSGQRWDYSLIVDDIGTKLKIEISRGYTDDNSGLSGYIFNTNTQNWNQLVFSPMEKDKNTFTVFYQESSYGTKPAIELFRKDAEAIIDELKQIVY
jgi:hypothetical protein